MKLPISWLNEYVEVSDIPAQELAERLTRSGLQVEAIETTGPEPLSDFFVAVEVKTCEAHPDSDHLHVTTVTDGHNKGRGGYIPDDESYGAQVFEVLSSGYKQGYAQKAIVDGLLDLIHDATH